MTDDEEYVYCVLPMTRKPVPAVPSIIVHCETCGQPCWADNRVLGPLQRIQFVHVKCIDCLMDEMENKTRQT